MKMGTYNRCAPNLIHCAKFGNSADTQTIKCKVMDHLDKYDE